jgi:hypothetical protein
MANKLDLLTTTASPIGREVERLALETPDARRTMAKGSHWLRTVFSFPAFLVSVVAVTVFVICRNGLSDPDIWWHLRNAEYLFSDLKLPRVDMCSFTVIGHPWTNHEWGAEIPYYLAWRLGGLVGIKLVSVLLLEAIFLGLMYLCWKQSRNIKAAALACFPSIFLGSVSFGPRTLLFGYVYLLILMLLLERFRSRGKAPLWVVPLLFCLWINTHGSWSLGLVVFAIIVASGMVEGRWGRIEAIRWSPNQQRQLLWTMGASVAVLFVNPYGYRLVLYPLVMPYRVKLGIAHVAEWVSVDFHDFRGKVVLVLIVALLFAALVDRHSWKLHEVGLVLFGMYSGLTYSRFLFLFGILVAPLVAKSLDFLPPYRPEIDKRPLNALLMAGCLVFMVRGFPSAAALEQSVNKEYPAEVLPYLQSHPPAGPVLNFYLWGGYLNWKDHDFKNFVDSRVDIFEDAGVFKDYIDLNELRNPSAILDKYAIRYVLFPPGEPLSLVLKHDPNWKVTYSGVISTVFERVGTPPAAAGTPGAPGVALSAGPRSDR